MYNKNIIELFCKIFHLLHGVTAHPVAVGDLLKTAHGEPCRASQGNQKGLNVDGEEQGGGWVALPDGEVNVQRW